MSLPQTIELLCPNCQKEFSAQVWASVNVTVSPELKEKVLEGTLNAVFCPQCKFTGRYPEPLLYHDMGRNLMFYGFPLGKNSRTEAEVKIDETLVKLREITGLKSNLYILDSMEDLQQIVDMLENAESAEDLTPDDWKDVVESILMPPMPWTLDHSCICGEQIPVVCFCTEPGVPLDIAKYEPDIPPDLTVECPKCHRLLLGFHCPKCNRVYQWNRGIVEHARPNA